MSFWIGDDRRKKDRVDFQEKFRCFVGGKRFVTQTLNVSPGGAFLETDRVIKPGSVMVLEQVKPGYDERPPHLVAKVLHFAMSPAMGVGLQWVKVISENGIANLRSFLNEVLGIEIDQFEISKLPVVAEENPVSYDFATGRVRLERVKREKKEDKIVSMFGIKVSERAMDKLGLSSVKVVHSEAPKQKRAVVDRDDSMVSRVEGNEDPLEAAKQMEEWMRLKRVGKRIKVNVVLVFEGKNVKASALAISSNSMFVQAPERLPAPGKRILVQFPIETAKRIVKIILVVELKKALRDRTSGDWGASLKIVTMNEGENQGMFKRYIKNL
jgi:hypothetical protein